MMRTATAMSNLTEYLNGTDPLNPASFPTLPAFNLGLVGVQAAMSS